MISEGLHQRLGHVQDPDEIARGMSLLCGGNLDHAVHVRKGEQRAGGYQKDAHQLRETRISAHIKGCISGQPVEWWIPSPHVYIDTLTRFKGSSSP